MDLIAVHSIMLTDGREIYGYDREGDPLLRVRTREVLPRERFAVPDALARELLRDRAAIRTDDVQSVENLHDRAALLIGGLTMAEEGLI